jgi:hypothetical protein
MTISMPVRRRWPAAVAGAIVGAAVGLVIGLAVSGGDDSDPVEAVRDARSTASRAAGILDVVPIEYGQAVQSGGEAEEGLRGAQGAVERSRSVYQEVRPVVSLIDPQAATAIDHRYARLLAAIGKRSRAPQVNRATERLQELLRESLGLT